ncbi:porin, partial [Turicimonas muris]
MKKSLIALAVLGASSVAFAASNVTLYGVLDGGVVVSKAKKADTKVQAKSGFDSGSRWGLKGVEDLGNGYSVGFQLEQGYNLDDGTTANGTGTFTRESRLFVQGGFGTLSFGRFGSLASGA